MTPSARCTCTCGHRHSDQIFVPCTLQERCRELEAELADLNLDLQELTTALAKVEADAAASAEEKQILRQEYEGKIEAVVKQMAGLQQQMKQQVGPQLCIMQQCSQLHFA